MTRLALHLLARLYLVRARRAYRAARDLTARHREAIARLRAMPLGRRTR